MASGLPPESDDRSVRIGRCELSVDPQPWPFAERCRAEIAGYWQRAVAERPKLFDGTVFMLREGVLDGEMFRGTFLRTDFKSFLYWRDNGYADASVRDSFGSAVIRSGEGHVLLGRQTSGNVNAGLAYPPGGFIDARDVRDAAIDIEASIARELIEETGLDPVGLARVPGYLLTHAGPLVSIGVEWKSPLPAEALRARILAHVEQQSVPELADVVIVRSADEIDEDMMPRYAKVLLRQLLSA
jgi:8-oxo-dGTP pyrophosphatase MutT (NUDIX family)